MLTAQFPKMPVQATVRASEQGGQRRILRKAHEHTSSLQLATRAGKATKGCQGRARRRADLGNTSAKAAGNELEPCRNDRSELAA